jgi:hypothetical protein
LGPFFRFDVFCDPDHSIGDNSLSLFWLLRSVLLALDRLPMQFCLKLLAVSLLAVMGRLAVGRTRCRWRQWTNA